MLSMSYMGDHVWLITSRQTEPDLGQKNRINFSECLFHACRTHNSQLVDVWVENSVDESDARAFVWVLVRQFDVDLPKASGKWC